ncbi:MAG: hypothetical protein SOT81_09730 [Treponema sp.]|nr:hypothetical protein [Treponema sp.]
MLKKKSDVFSFYGRLLFVLAFLPFFGCSSAPKRPMLVTDTYTLAHSRLENANNELLSGKLPAAKRSLSESYSLAVSVDSAALLTKICLSGVSYKILENQLGDNSDSKESKNSESDFASSSNLEFQKSESAKSEISSENSKSGGNVSSALVSEKSLSIQTEKKSFLDGDLNSILSEAKSFARRSSEKDALLDLCALYEVRVMLTRVRLSNEKNLSESEKRNLLEILTQCEKSVSKEPYYGGFLSRTRGDVYVSLSDFKNAGKSYLEAAQIHTKNRYLYEIALDWYGAARACSLGGDKSGAVNAIENALKYDRDAENSAALALDYLAYSKILLKGEPTESEIKKAKELENISEKIRENSKALN